MAGQKRAADGAGSSPETRAAKSAKVGLKDAATSKKPASKASDKPASKSKSSEKPASKSKPSEKHTKTAGKAASKSAGKAKAKAAMSPEDFKAKALPLHAHITQIPPKLDESKDDLAAPSTSDAGFLASIAMQPSTFSTKSYGWKGSRRLTIPLPGGADGETVTVMININATVAGSKDASAEAEKEDLAAAVKEDLASGSDSD
ncbi:hypothetical protein CTheo_2162 [Ceratobasidium theobromae]|uniref:Uncharacterized protein n=1 Tax=Ceratobasidium theobromae TaxID=1582974 RepID=A0A5N5QRL2_9AGAM|nr:hypothetical protein CTheo_2162 [Ceratobasidium theobromae]